MTVAERQKAKRLRRKLADKETLTADETAWLARYEKGIASNAKSMEDVDGPPPKVAPVAPPAGAAPGGASTLPPLDVTLPGEVAQKGKPNLKVIQGGKGEKKVAPRDPETGHVIPTPMGQNAAMLYKNFVTVQNDWLKANDGKAIPAEMIDIGAFATQQLVDNYISPYFSGDMGMAFLAAATPVGWVMWFKHKKQSGLEERMEKAEADRLHSKEQKPVEGKQVPRETPRPKEPAREVSDTLPLTAKEIQNATSAIMGGKGPVTS